MHYLPIECFSQSLPSWVQGNRSPPQDRMDGDVGLSYEKVYYISGLQRSRTLVS